MVHRDPTTGQYVSGDGSQLTYADHDVHWIRHEASFLASADSGPLTGLNDVQQWEITERGLDPDELAELRALTVDVTLGTVGDPIDQDEIGEINLRAQAGFNLSLDEFVLNNASTEGVDVDNSGTDDFNVVTNDTDEVGQLFAANLHGYPGYSDTTDGTGGAGGMPSLHETIHFPAMFGSGPVVDAVDDFSTHLRLDVNNMVAQVTAQATYQAVYAVEESESGRTRFGR